MTTTPEPVSPAVDELAQFLIQQIVELTSDDHVARLPSLRLSDSEVPELEMLRLTSWVYCLHNESAKDAFRFIRQLASKQTTDAHTHQVGSLRTYFQHHLTDSDRDQETRRSAERYLTESADSTAHLKPRDSDWAAAVTRLTRETTANLSALIPILKEIIEEPPLLDATRKSWAVSRSRTVPPHEVDSMIDLLSRQLGLDYLDVRQIRERHYSKWSRSLTLLSPEEETVVHLTGLIERELLNLSEVAPLPISGEDVMDAFGLPPGPMVGQVLRAVKKLHSEGSKSREQLLRDVATEFDLEILS